MEKQYTIVGVSEWKFYDTDGNEHILDKVKSEKITFENDCESVTTLSAEINHVAISEELLQAFKDGLLDGAQCINSMWGYDIKTSTRENINILTWTTVKEISFENVDQEVGTIKIKLGND